VDSHAQRFVGALPDLEQALHGSSTRDYKTTTVACFDTVKKPMYKLEKPIETLFATLHLLWFSNKTGGTKRN
jgi:hypothetical protein